VFDPPIEEAMMASGWEEVEHTADLALRVWGNDLRDLFVNAARGMLSLMGSQQVGDDLRQTRISLTAPDAETLLVEWLNELLYLIEEEKLFIAKVEVARVDGRALEAEVVGGQAADMAGHIKAATYHDLAIERTPSGYSAVVVFDV
jgi:SHS2 domain-containing protein